jgi:hypothetical protein
MGLFDMYAFDKQFQYLFDAIGSFCNRADNICRVATDSLVCIGQQPEQIPQQRIQIMMTEKSPDGFLFVRMQIVDF